MEKTNNLKEEVMEWEIDLEEKIIIRKLNREEVTYLKTLLEKCEI